jgi:hypothetical protein
MPYHGPQQGFSASSWRPVLNIVNGRWATMKDIMRQTNNPSDVVFAILMQLRESGFVVRKRDNGDTREYRVFVVGCRECGEPVDNIHKATCSKAGTTVSVGQGMTREW